MIYILQQYIRLRYFLISNRSLSSKSTSIFLFYPSIHFYFLSISFIHLTHSYTPSLFHFSLSNSFLLPSTSLYANVIIFINLHSSLSISIIHDYFSLSPQIPFFPMKTSYTEFSFLREYTLFHIIVISIYPCLTQRREESPRTSMHLQHFPLILFLFLGPILTIMSLP